MHNSICVGDQTYTQIENSNKFRDKNGQIYDGDTIPNSSMIHIGTGNSLRNAQIGNNTTILFPSRALLIIGLTALITGVGALALPLPLTISVLTITLGMLMIITALFVNIMSNLSEMALPLPKQHTWP